MEYIGVGSLEGVAEEKKKGRFLARIVARPM